MIDQSRQDVSLGDVDLMLDGDDVPYEDGFTLRVTGEDASLGASESVTSVLLSMLTNGSLVTRDRDENRQPTLIVEVEAEYDDGLALARGEELLRSVVGKPVERSG